MLRKRATTVLVMAMGWGAACAPDGSPGSTSVSDTEVAASVVADTDDTDSTTEITDAPEPPGPMTDTEVAGVEAALSRFAESASSLDFGTVQAAVEAIREQETARCPSWREIPLGPIWSGDCTTSNGTRFFGNFVLVENGWDEHAAEAFAGGLVAAQGPLVAPGWQSGPVEVTHVEGYFATCSVEHDVRMIAMSGFYHDLWAVSGDLTMRETLWEGEVIDPDNAGSWAARGLVPNLKRRALFSGAGGYGIWLQGALTWSPGEVTDGYGTIWASDLWMANEAASDACTAEPVGMISVRDGEGSWYDVVFDGDEDTSRCDGCGEVSRAGTVVGQVCPDMSPLLTAVQEEPR